MGSFKPEEVKGLIPIYFHNEYVAIQGNQIVDFSNDDFHVVFTLHNGVAYSFKQSPFGSFFLKRSCTYERFLDFENQIIQHLKQKRIQKVVLRNPPFYYDSFISREWLEKAGYSLNIQDINQYIPLVDHPEEYLHKMEFRKLVGAERDGLLFSHDPISTLDEIHSFIAFCREDAGLAVNIPLEKLRKLFITFPSCYSLYSIRRDQKILAACVVSRPLPDIYYYYLPATHPDHKSKSPMVLLLVSLMESLKSKGAKILDLGLSSIDGKKQSGLYAFKKRMGAIETPSLVFEKDID